MTLPTNIDRLGWWSDGWGVYTPYTFEIGKCAELFVFYSPDEVDNDEFIIDVSEYRKNKDRNLERLAKNIAREVSNTKVEATLDSMNSYERRVIHNALKDYKYVYTESIGEEPNRKIVVSLKK